MRTSFMLLALLLSGCHFMRGTVMFQNCYVVTEQGDVWGPFHWSRHYQSYWDDKFHQLEKDGCYLGCEFPDKGEDAEWIFNTRQQADSFLAQHQIYVPEEKTK